MRARSDAGIFVALFGTACVIYIASALLIYQRWHSPLLAYFDQLAFAFLHGELHLANTTVGYDLTYFDGRWYVPFPPLPAILMMPFVAVLGLEGFNTAIFSAVIGAVNVGLVFAVVRALTHRGWSTVGRSGAVWLAVLMAFGCAHWFVAPLGTVWFISQVCTVTGVLLAAWAAVAIRRVPFAAVCAGLGMAVTMLARPHLAFAAPLVFGILAQRVVDFGCWLLCRCWLRSRCCCSTTMPVLATCLTLVISTRTWRQVCARN